MTVALFKDQDYRLILNTGITLAGATVLKILYKKPDGTRGFWNAAPDVQNIFHDVTPIENDLEGVWTFQSYVEIGGKVYFGDEITKEILDNLKE